MAATSRSFTRWPDALFELLDAVSRPVTVASIAQLTLTEGAMRGHGSAYAPLDAVRLRIGDNTNAVAVAQIPALIPRLDLRGQAPLVAFDGGYDPVQLAVGLADTGVQTVVRIKSDRRFSARPPKRPPNSAGGRPPRRGPRFSCNDPAAWPNPDQELTREQVASMDVV